MDYMITDKFIKFQYGWNKELNLENELKQFLNILNSAKEENDVQKYIKDNKKWFIPASIFEDDNVDYKIKTASIETDFKNIVLDI